MPRTTRPGRAPFAGVLAFLLLVVPNAAFSDDKEQEDRKKQIADVEKQIADLAKKLDDLKKKPADKVTPTLVAGTIPDDYTKKMTWRSIGPANMGGRVTALAVVESDPSTYFVASASGGLLKTTNNGTTFKHLFDKEATVSIGDVAVAPSDPKTVWVGTGENNPRNSVSYGDGVYKSTDGGETWANMGLKKSFCTGKIIIHPKDPNTVYVGSMGRIYGPNEERGLFKTTDGGKTWSKVLYIDNKTGVIDMRMDPTDPNTLIVATWEMKRDEFDCEFGPSSSWPTPDQYGPAVTHAAGSGIHRTTDAGKTWKKLTDPAANSGLPTVKLGRVGLDYSHKTKGLIYAVIDTEKVGTGRKATTVYAGVASEDEKGVGLKVTDVYDDGPAKAAGLKAGDVILKMDDKKIADYDAFTAFLAEKKAGDVVKVTVKRGGKDAKDAKETVLEMKLAPRPGTEDTTPKGKGGGGQGKGGGKGGQGGGGQAGSMLMPGFTPAVALEGPVKVASVPKDGPAEKAGVKAGMEVVAIDGKEVAGFREFLTELRVGARAENPRQAGDKVKVKFRQDKKDIVVELAMVTTEVQMQFGGGGRGVAPAGKPHLMDNTVGGQRPNVQDQQGKDGFQTGGVYASKDNGTTWKRVNSLNPRPFYFSQVRVDPTDDNTIYVLGDTTLWKSTNGGERFSAAPAREVHPDHHALWISPKDGRHMIIGCDGGFCVTYDRGAVWDYVNVVALGQFYHVAVDNRKPYRVYGGLQDNGSWGGPSHVFRPTGPTNDDWNFLNGGDGFVCRVDPTDPDLVYFESQGGAIGRRNLRTGERGFSRPSPVKQGEQLRWNWNTPFILSSHNPSIFYSGAQYVFRSVNKGTTLKAISPELTRTMAGSMTAIAESPRNADVLWAGTDDGNVWVTKDGGAKWTNVADKFKAAGLPGPRWVASIEPSRTKEGRCYVAFDAHRSDDDKPYLFKSEDYGETWTAITANLPAFGSTRVLREDYVNPDLLYCGTEFGIWASVNQGKSWTQLKANLPTVAVHEVAQPTTANEIVIATHGRSVWIMDVSTLRQMNADNLKAAATLFPPGNATRWRPADRQDSPYSINVRKFFGTNPARGAIIDYALTAPAKEVSVAIIDVTGKKVREFRSAAATVGMHRLEWNLSSGGGGGFGGPGGGGRGGFGGGASVPAGGYRVVLTVDGKEFAQPLVVENDPNADPKALIAGGAEVEQDEEEEVDLIIPFIPKAKD